MGRWFSLLGVAALGVAGCFAPPEAGPETPVVGTRDPNFFPTGIEPQNRTVADYWLVVVEGAERFDRERGPANEETVCTSPWLYQTNEEEEMLWYNANESEIDRGNLTILVIVDYSDVRFYGDAVLSGCQPTRALYGFPGTAQLSVPLGQYGVLNLDVFPQGVLGVQKTWAVPLGLGVAFDYTRTGTTDTSGYWVNGSWQAVNHGAWPLERLNPIYDMTPPATPKV